MTEIITKELLKQSIKEHKDFMEMVCENKYGHKNIKDVIEGVIEYCKITDKYQQELLRDGRFIPAGSILSKCNSKTKGSFSNCYFTPIERDTIEDIFECQKKLARTFSFRGGSGVDITVLRPSNADVNNAAKQSSGAVSFMPSFSELTKTIAQKGRRGALIITLDIRHPDALKFIWSKAKPEDVFEKDTFTGQYPTIDAANISLKVTDEFMNAVKNNNDFTFSFPDINSDKEKYNTEWDGDYDKWIKNGGKLKYYDTLKARDILDQISEAAWMCGDPGIWFVDTAQKNTFGTYIDEKLKPIGVNPSMPKGVLVHTQDGIFEIQDLEGKEFNVKSLDGSWAKAKCFLSGENEEIYRFKIGNEKYIYSTAEHRWPLIYDKKIKKYAKDIKVGDRIPLNRVEKLGINGNTNLTFDEGFLCGVIYGDGWISKRSESGKLVCGISFNKNDEDLANKTLSILNCLKKNNSTISERNNELTIQFSEKEICNKFGIEFGLLSKDNLPKILWRSNDEFIKGFIDGYFSTDGCVGNKDVTINSSRKIAIQELCKLLSFFGINSTLTFRENFKATFPNNKDYDKTYSIYRLRINKKESVKFNELFKISSFKKNKKLKDLVGGVSILDLEIHKNCKSVKVEEIDIIGREKVWDITVYHDEHVFPSQYCYSGNCGEQGLAAYNNCLLGAFVLTEYIDEYDNFDFDKYEKDVGVATRLMNIFSDINESEHPLKEQIENDKFGKRIGLELTGFADTCAILNYKYGDVDSQALAKYLTENLLKNSIRESCEIAKEKGPCEAFQSVDNRERFFLYSPVELGEDLTKDILDYGLANTSFNTIGPCGSISIVSGNVSSGIEPVFMFSYKRKNRIDGKEYSFIHLPAAKYMLNNLDNFEGLTLTQAKENIGYIEADEVNWKDRIKIQSAFQSGIDSSISSTINLNNNCNTKEIRDIYLYAWENYLKGITVFRDGCKTGVLSSNKEKEKEVEGINALPELFEKELLDEEYSIRHRVSWKGSKLYINVSLDEDNKPIEVFTKLPKEAGINTDGTFSSILWQEKTSLWDSLCRCISTSLRYGIPIEEIIDQLNKSTYSLVDAAGILKRILSKYINNEDEDNYFQICKECGDKSYILEGGCGKCISCGFSECG